MELISIQDGVRFINDSKATSVDALAHGVAATEGILLLIAGGVDKGGSFASLLPLFRGKVRRLFALGQAARRIERELGTELRVECVSSLEEGVRRARQEVRVGESVLLSPGCS